MSADRSSFTRLLVVDDSRLILKAAPKMLGAEFDVVTASDGVDAWEILERDHTVQVVFTDLDMPNCDGYELLRKVRASADPGLQSMPVSIATGANDDESARLKSLRLGATDFITKPYSSTDLVARARVHAKYQRIARQLETQTTLDALTGLANKRGFLDRLQQDIAYARRHLHAITLAWVEIDDLRSIFLKRGKGAADQLLISVAALIGSRIRKEDTAARVGLGGFAISMPGGHLEGSEGMLARLCAEAAANAPSIDGVPFPIVLKTAALSAELQHWPSAQEALDRCQALLENPAAPVPEASAAGATPTAEVIAATPATPDATTPAPTPATPTEPPASSAQSPAPIPAVPAASTAPKPAITTAPEPLRLDPLLDQVKQGHTREAIDKMPQVMQRLTPLLRLLSANQRLQLIRFLEKLGSA